MKRKKSKPIARRVVTPDGKIDVIRLGLSKNYSKDLFHIFLDISWVTVGVLYMVSFFVANGLFAFIYSLDPNGIYNAKTYSDLFNFSVHTMATVGYGSMYPTTFFTNMVADVEALTGLTSFAVTSGIVFAKFAKPISKIIFSEIAIMGVRDHKPHLMFRIANARRNQLFDAKMSVAMMKTVKTEEGEVIRTFQDMKLVRAQNPIFALTWTVLHPIDEESPFYEKSVEELKKLEPEVIVTFTGVDDVYYQNVYARHSYLLDEIKWNVRFKDILTLNEEGRRVINFHDFHQTEPLQIKEGSTT